MAGFKDIIGHEQIIEHLQNAIGMDKVSHAYIINGPDKSGKMMLAEAFAMALQCEKHGKEACMECHSCRQALGHNQPDIIYVNHEKPNTISVDDIRTQVNNDIDVKPYSSEPAVTECTAENHRGAAGICGHHAFDNECGHISANDLIQMRDVEY